MLSYLTIGHISRDITPEGPRLGGTVSFSALTAAVLGCQVRILTSASPAEHALLTPLRTTDLTVIPSRTPTAFKNVYTPEGRQQTLLSQAETLHPEHLPAEWADSDIIHLAPIAQEVNPTLLNRFPAETVRIITPQGYLRQWTSEGLVRYAPWPAASDVLAHTDAVIFSIEDVNHDEAAAQHLAQAAPIGIITRADQGATLHIDAAEAHTIAAPTVTPVDPTGAGDIFATSFAVRLTQTGDPLRAAHFATFLASYSVTKQGAASIPNAQLIEEAYARH